MRLRYDQSVQGVQASWLLLALTLTACAAEPPRRTDWEGCLQRSTPEPSMTVCGTVQVRGAIIDTLNFSVQVEHDLPISTLFIDSDADLSSEGSLFRSGTTWRLQLGTIQPRHTGEVAVTSDDGSIEAKLEAHGDSLAGSWLRTCLFDACPESGTVWLIPIS